MLASALIILVIIAAICGFAFVKNGEMSGLGRMGVRGGVRSPHGRLTRTKRLDEGVGTSFVQRFSRIAIVMFAVAVIVFAACALGIVSLRTSVAVGLSVLLTSVAALLTAGSRADHLRSFAYAITGYLAFSAPLGVLWALSVPGVSDLGAMGANALTVVLGALGGTTALSLMPDLRTYAREFEDGHVDVIVVSRRSVACREFERLGDGSWTPPEDRVGAFEKARELRSGVRRG